MRLVALATVAGLTLSACGPGDVPPVGDDAGPDGNSGMGGLRFVFSAPGLGETVDGVTIERLELKLRDIRALGDAAPGDERTSLDRKELQLESPTDSDDIHFDQAPPGRYGSFEMVVAAAQDGEDSWSLEGTVVIDSEEHSFAVEDEDSHPIDLVLDFDLEPGETASIPIHVDVQAILEPIDWETAPMEGEEVKIDEDYAGMPAIRSQFLASFSIGTVVVE